MQSQSCAIQNKIQNRECKIGWTLTRTPKNAKTGAVVLEDKTSSTDWSHPSWFISPYQVKGLSQVQIQCVQTGSREKTAVKVSMSRSSNGTIRRQNQCVFNGIIRSKNQTYTESQGGHCMWTPQVCILDVRVLNSTMLEVKWHFRVRKMSVEQLCMGMITCKYIFHDTMKANIYVLWVGI
jgi:hypothetical protein